LPEHLMDLDGNGNSRNTDEKELAKLKADHASVSSFELVCRARTPHLPPPPPPRRLSAGGTRSAELLASIGVPTMMNGSSESVFQEFETPRSPFDLDSIAVAADKHLPSSLPTKSYNADANNARLDHMVQTLDSKIERTHEMLLQVKEECVEVIMKKLDSIMKKFNVDSIDLDRRPS